MEEDETKLKNRRYSEFFGEEAQGDSLTREMISDIHSKLNMLTKSNSESETM